jgi:hypothetical protein
VYPPPALRLGEVSGLHCTIPNGTSAPGNVFPPLVVHVRASTSAAGSVTGCVIGVVFVAPAGSLFLGTGSPHDVAFGRDAQGFDVMRATPVCVPAAISGPSGAARRLWSRKAVVVRSTTAAQRSSVV